MPATDPLDEINRIGRQTALPAVSPTAPPAVNQTNLNVASSMERADIGNRFGFGSPQYQQGTETPRTFAPDTTDIMNSAIDNRMAAIASGQDPDAPARYVGPKRSDELQKEFLALGESRRRNAFNDARIAQQQFVDQQHIRSATEASEFFNRLNDINNDPNTPLNSDAHTKAVIKAAIDLPFGMQTKAVQDALKIHTRINDATVSIAERAKQMGIDPEQLKGMQVKTFVAGSGRQSHVTYELPGSGKKEPVFANAEKVLAKKGVTTEEFAARSNLRRGTKPKSGKFVGSNNGEDAAIDVGGQTIYMPYEDYLSLDHIIPVKSGATPQQTQSTGTTGAAKKVLKYNPTTGELE